MTDEIQNLKFAVQKKNALIQQLTKDVEFMTCRRNEAERYNNRLMNVLRRLQKMFPETTPPYHSNQLVSQNNIQAGTLIAEVLRNS